MTPAEFRAARRRLGLSRAAMLDELRRLGWPELASSTLDTWGTRGAPPHVAVILTLMERQRTAQPPA